MEKIDIKIRYTSNRIGKDIPKPIYATEGAAGLDLRADIKASTVINPMEHVIVPTGICIELPSSEYVALVYARSGLAIRHGISLSNGVGVIDSDYRGEISCSLVNLSDKGYTIEPGERIAQIVITPIFTANFIETEELAPTMRDDGKFGSTGRV